MSLWKFRPGIAAILYLKDVAGEQEHCAIYMGPDKTIIHKGSTEYPLRGFPLPDLVKRNIEDHFCEVFKLPASKREGYLRATEPWQIEVPA